MPDVVTPETSSPSKPLSLREYGAHLNVSATAVFRAIKKERLKRCLVYDAKGKPKIGDVAIADAEWAANTDLSKAPGSVKERAAPGGSPRRVKASALAEASTREKEARAKLAELEYLRKSGTQIEIEPVLAAVMQHITIARNRLMGLSSGVRQRHPEASAAMLATIDELIRQALEELAASVATSFHGTAA